MSSIAITLRVFLALTLLAATSISVQADEPISFERGGLKGNDWTFFKDYLEENYPLIIKYVAEIRGLSTEVAWEPLRRYVLYLGRYDLNGDGVEELFVTIEQGFVCGTAGCTTLIFQKTSEQWRELSSIMVMISDRVGPELLVSDEVIKGYRTLYAEFDGLRWNGREYASFCVKRCKEG